MRFNFLSTVKHSFRAKVILVSSLFILAISIALTVYYIALQYAYQNDALIIRAKLLVSTLMHSAKVGIFSENASLLKDPIAGVTEQREVLAVSIFSSSGKLLAHAQNPHSKSAAQSDPETGKIDDELLARLRQSGLPVYFSDQNVVQIWSSVLSAAGFTTEESLFFKEKNSEKKTSIIGFVNIVLSKALIRKQLYAFLYKAVFWALSATIIGSVVMFFVIRGITGPLDRLTQGIKVLGSEGVAEKIPVYTEDEIGRLAIAFNEMSESLRARRAENLSLEIKLRQAQKLEALGTLAGGIAHDFNNVLSPIVGFTEIVMDEVPENGEIYNDLQEVYNAAMRAKELVKQILAFSRQAESARVPQKIQPIVKEVLKLLRASLPATIAISQDIDEDCGPIFADSTDIHRIVMNLCTNAYHAMRDNGGELRVVLEEYVHPENDQSSEVRFSPGKYLKLTVSDTGVGIDDETLQRIFDPYFTTKPQGEGTGMGLAVVHGIIQSYGGEIQVHSEPGSGTALEIYLPMIETETGVAEPNGVEPLQGGQEHILLVDDEVQIVLMVKRMLEQLGYRVTTRTSSIEALEAFAFQPDTFDLIISDQTMPNITGDELAVEAMRIRSDIPVIICTGFSEKINNEKAIEKGIRRLLMKPVIKQDLAKTVREVLDGNELRVGS